MTPPEAESFVNAFLAKEQAPVNAATVVLCPAAPVIETVSKACAGTALRWGGQNAHWEPEGAFTGEVSMRMLRALGCGYVLCGHSERRAHCHETDQDVSRKVQQAVANGLEPILCVGESFAQRQQQTHEVTVSEQVRKGVDLLSAFPQKKFTIAYEPVWAIGTGHPIEPDQAWAMARLIHQTLREEMPDTAESVPIIYGGSINPENVRSFVDGEHLVGVLVGGASLDPTSFHDIIAELTKK